MMLENYYWYFQSAIPKRLCDDILQYGLKHQDTLATTGDGEDELENTGQLSESTLKNIQKKRKSNVVWMNDPWIYKEIQPYVHQANKNAGWNFDWDWTEDCQFTKYDIGQYYGWHTDQFNSPNKSDDPNRKGKVRKLSMTISLNDATEYDGGQLEFDFKNESPDEWADDTRKNTRAICHQIAPVGSVVVFPSFVWHRVTPVTRGTRFSLVAWSWGQPYR